MRFPFAAALLLFATITHADGPDRGPDDLKGLKYRNIGPSSGSRVCRACGVPGDPLTYYAASAGGGIWKSSDGGLSWKPMFDDATASSVGSIAVAPSDPNVIYAGTGEANIRGNVAAGDGIYRSTDAGKTWKHVWTNVGQIGTMAVHPTNADVAYAAVLGNPFGPGEGRGVYRTTDGGKTWKRVLFVDADTGASDVALDRTNPRTVFAGTWQTRRKPWELTSGGPGSGLYVSHDGGDSWKKLEPGQRTSEGKEIGLPKYQWGKVCVSVAPSDGQRVYAMIEAENGGLFRSDDGGETWARANSDRAIRQRAWYFSVFTVDPTNPDVLWFPQVPMLRSIDGGKSLQRVGGAHHGDHHDVWIDPTNANRVIIANDGGVDISTNGGKTWYAPPLPIAQFYHIACDNRVPYRVGGCIQDIGAMDGPSNSLKRDIPFCDWEAIGGGEAGHVAYDPGDPDIVFAGEYSGYISRFDRKTRQARNMSAYPFDASGHGGEALKYRFQWTAPIVVSPHDRAVYHGANVLFRSRDGGQNWERLSGDLTRNDKNKQKWSGGPITGDNTGVETYATIFAISESPKQKGVLWVGSDDGLVHVSKDDGKTWENVTANVPELPDWGTVTCVEPSPFDAGTAYLVVEAHRMSDFRPHLWATADFGNTWRRLSTGLPANEYLHVVRCDPKKKGQLYVGSERGVWFSANDGAEWHRLRLNLPTVAVHDLVVKGDDLVVGTMGRSIWILDDLTPVREWPAPKKLHLFTPLPAVRWRLYGTPASDFERSPGQNPPYGAEISYVLPAKPSGVVKLQILDAMGVQVAELESKEEEKKDEDLGAYGGDQDKKKPIPTAVGVNRVAWDLKLKGATPIKGAKVDAGDPEEGPLALPGEYTLKLSADGQSVTAKLTVKPDPRVILPPGALEEQLRFAVLVRDDINTLTAVVNPLRVVRKQLAERQELLKDEPTAKELLAAAKKLAEKLDALEERLHNPKAKTVYDILAQKGGAKLYSQFTSVYATVIDGDGPPTQGVRDLYADLSKELRELQAQWLVLKAGDIAVFNEQAKKLDVPGLWVPKK